MKFDISYPNEKQIKVNNKIFDIEKENCTIYIRKKFETMLNYNTRTAQVSYFIIFQGDDNVSLQITDSVLKSLEELIKNFEFDSSELEISKRKAIQEMQDKVEELYMN